VGGCGRTRTLGPLGAGALVVGNMIGVGAFTTSGFALAELGGPGPVLAAWLVGGAIAACGALAYGALAGAMPESGGEYLYLRHGVHPLAGFLAGWVSLWAGFTAPLAAAVLALDLFVAAAWGGATAGGVGAVALILAGALHARWRAAGVALQTAAVGVQLLALAAFVALGAPRAAAAGASLAGGWSEVTPAGFGRTLLWVGFAYSGWNAAVYVAGEVRDAPRTLPRALLGATALVSVAYLALNAVLLAAAPHAAGRGDIGASAAAALGGVPLQRGLAALIALGLWTSISSLLLAGSRVSARMAADGALPAWLAARGATPAAAIALQMLLALAVAASVPLATVLATGGFLLGLCAAASVATLLWRSGGRLPAATRAAAIAFVLATAATMVALVARAPGEAAIGCLVVAAGVPVYWRVRASGGGLRC